MPFFCSGVISREAFDSCSLLYTSYEQGPDSERIYDVDGYTTYIPHDFLKLDFIDRCYIVNEVLLDHAMSQGEL